MRRQNLDTSQTLFALSSGSLPSAVAIVRLSGSDAFAIAGKLFRANRGIPLPRKRDVLFGTLSDLKQRKIDEVLALTFVSPHSFTGEDVVEFQCHGSVPVVRRLEEALAELGARPAKGGEFSFRAFLNGKLSGADLENLGDVFQARESADLERIYSRRDGALADSVGRLRSELIRVQAILDTAIDFSDEYSEVVSSAKSPLRLVVRECSLIIQRYSAFREGIQRPRLVLVGRTNAGKSSLFNALLCRYRALVHSEPGTTRDVIEEDIELGGRHWKLVDTAGIRSEADGSERQGIELGQDFLAASSFWILVVDGTRSRLSIEETRLLETHGDKPHLIVWNKMDSPSWNDPSGLFVDQGVISVSAADGAGIVALWEEIQGRTSAETRMEPLPTSLQSSRLRGVVESLSSLESLMAQSAPPEYLAEQNRAIVRQLENVIGEVDPEEVLDRVFGEFCIGK